MKAILENDKCFSCVNHKIGQAFNTDGIDRTEISIDEARTAFDFELVKHQSCTEDGRPLPKQWHLRRTDDDAIVPTRGLGDEFQPVQHLQVFDYIVNDIMPQVPEMKLETVGTMHGGGTGMIMAKFGDGFSISGDKSPHESRLFFFNPNGKSSLIMGTCNVRLWCQNQLQAAVSSTKDSVRYGNGIRIFHTTNADIRLDHAIDAIYAQVGAIRHMQRREERLANEAATEANLVHILNKLLPLNNFEEGSKGWTRMMNQREAILTQWREGETAQSFEGDTFAKVLNSITYPIYNPISIGKATDLAQITYSGTVGSRADRVSRILAECEREAGLSVEVAA